MKTTAKTIKKQKNFSLSPSAIKNLESLRRHYGTTQELLIEKLLQEKTDRLEEENKAFKTSDLHDIMIKVSHNYAIVFSRLSYLEDKVSELEKISK